MKKDDFYYPSSDGRTQIHARIWKPDDDVQPKAVLQIMHGMVEFIGRYSHFASFLTDHGYVVVGNDHLGHGESVVDDDDYGYFGRPGNVIKDVDRLRNMTSEMYPDVPYFVMGHSMGSFVVRQYITEHARGLSGVIIMGTGWQPGPVIRLGKRLSGIIGRVKGGRYRSDLLHNMVLGSNNKKIANPRTAADWLTKDEDIVDWYLGEDWCNFKFTVNAYNIMFRGMEAAHDKSKMAMLPPGLPILVISGEEDPVGGYGAGVRQTYEAYFQNSPCDVELKLYEGDRHEILNELDKDVVYDDLLNWMDGKI